MSSTMPYQMPYQGIGMGMGVGAAGTTMYAAAQPHQHEAKVVPMEAHHVDLDKAFEDALKQEEERLQEEKAKEAAEVDKGKEVPENGSGMGDFEA
jgi:hypothetical protein